MYPNIEAERARKGLTKEELAAVLGVDRKTYLSEPGTSGSVGCCYYLQYS